jgi:electron transfer flavoprotein beta subunit
MDILVLLKLVPDVVEELEVAPDGKSLDTQWLRLRVNETDEHALEEALLLKENHGGTVTVVALEGPEADDALYTALAKGADRAVKIPGEWASSSSSAIARILADAARSLPGADLYLTGAQAIDDLDGEIAPRLAHSLGLPYLGGITGIVPKDDAKTALVTKEYAGGVRAQFEIPLPAVLGIQAAERPPRYVPVARIRQAMKTGKVEMLPLAPSETASLLEIHRMFKPEVAGRAEFLEGSPEEVARKICDILAQHGLL